MVHIAHVPYTINNPTVHINLLFYISKSKKTHLSDNYEVTYVSGVVNSGTTYRHHGEFAERTPQFQTSMDAVSITEDSVHGTTVLV